MPLRSPAQLQVCLPIMKLKVLHVAVPTMTEGIMEKNFDNTPLPFHARLDKRMNDLGLSDAELANHLGYEKPNVIALMRTGQMRTPIQHAQPMAQALDLPESEIFEALMRESMPEVLRTIQAIYGLTESASS